MGSTAALQQALPVLVVLCVLALAMFEWATGKYKEGAKTRKDWQMVALSASGVAFIERPLLLFIVYLLMDALLPGTHTALGWLQERYLIPAVIGFILVDEFLQGGAHFLTHRPRPNNRLLAKVHTFYREAHRAHHMLGDKADKGVLNVTQASVAGWGWFLLLPNYWFGYIAIYLGLVEVWFWGTLIKTLWGAHVHTNWRYDLVLLNHRSAWVRNAMWALCHVFTFPNQHHQHHSRTGNSAKNMNNFLALYDWLFWKTLVIETERPKIYGWRQNARESSSAWYRYLHRSFS